MTEHLTEWLTRVSPQFYQLAVRALQEFAEPLNSATLAERLRVPKHTAQRLCRAFLEHALIVVVKPSLSNQGALYRSSGASLPEQPSRRRKRAEWLTDKPLVPLGTEPLWEKLMGDKRFEDHPRAVPLGLCRPLSNGHLHGIRCSSAGFMSDGGVYRLFR